MKTKRNLITLIAGASLFLAACAPKDADIQKAVKAKEADNITVAVDKGVVTLGGEVADDAAKANAEKIAQEEKGVKSVVNIINTVMIEKSVIIAQDSTLAKNVTDAVKDFPSVKADVNDGVVTLTGEIKKTELVALMQHIAALKPKKIENKLTVK